MGAVGLAVDGRALPALDVAAIRALPPAYDRGEGHAVLAADALGAPFAGATALVAEDETGAGLWFRAPWSRPAADAVVLVVNKRGEVVVTTRSVDDRGGHGRGGERGQGGPGLRVERVVRLTAWTAPPGG